MDEVEKFSYHRFQQMRPKFQPEHCSKRRCECTEELTKQPDQTKEAARDLYFVSLFTLSQGGKAAVSIHDCSFGDAA